MNHLTFYLLLALAAGACLPTQAGINSQLNLLIRSPIVTAAVSFGVGTVSLILYALINGAALPPPLLFKVESVVDLVRRFTRCLSCCIHRCSRP